MRRLQLAAEGCQPLLVEGAEPVAHGRRRGVGAAGGERRGGIVLDRKLDALRDLGARHLRRNGEREVDARRDAAAREYVAVAHDAGLLVLGADQRQQAGVGPVSGGAAALEKAGDAQHEGAGAHRGHVLRLRALAAHEVDRWSYRRSRPRRRSRRERRSDRAARIPRRWRSAAGSGRNRWVPARASWRRCAPCHRAGGAAPAAVP